MSLVRSTATNTMLETGDAWGRGWVTAPRTEIGETQHTKWQPDSAEDQGPLQVVKERMGCGQAKSSKADQARRPPDEHGRPCA